MKCRHYFLDPDGQIVVSGGGNGKLGLWNLKGNLIQKSALRRGITIHIVVFSPDSQRILIVSRGNIVRL